MPYFKVGSSFCQTGTSYWFAPPYEPEAYALFARMDEQPRTKLKRLINEVIKYLKIVDIWNYLDCYQSYNLHTQQASLLNWKQNKYNASIVNSLTWQQYVGFTGDGMSKYINNNFNPYNTGSLYQKNNSHFGITCTGIDANYGGHGVRRISGNYNCWIARSTANLYFGLNSAYANLLGNYFNHHIVLERDNAISFNLYVDVSKNTFNVDSKDILNYNFYTLCQNTETLQNYSTETAKQFFAGSYLGETKVQQFQNIRDRFNLGVSLF
jgi:hypothetical protein